MSATKIEWAEEVWNPVRGCTRVSEGCRNCYAERQAIRMAGPGGKYEGLVRSTPEGPRWTGRVNFDEATLLAPLHRKKPTRFFVNSMSDWCHEEVPDEWRDRMLAVAALCPQHTFIFLTKRAAHMRRYFSDVGQVVRGDFVRTEQFLIADTHDEKKLPPYQWPLPNVWLLVSVEDQATADERIPHLLATPAVVRGVSAEPLLGAVDFARVDITAQIAARMRQIWKREPLPGVEVGGPLPAAAWVNALTGHADSTWKVPTSPWPRLDWVICGGESGPGARPMHPDWARSLRDQCQAAGVPFFFKQWGEWGHGSYPECPERRAATVMNDGTVYPFAGWSGLPYPQEKLDNWVAYCPCAMARVGKHRAGRLLDGREHNEFPKEGHG